MAVKRKAGDGGGAKEWTSAGGVVALPPFSGEVFAQVNAVNDVSDAGQADAAGTWLIACSASAVIVRLGLTPGLVGITEPSQMRRFS